MLEDMEDFTLKIDNQGRVMLPSWWRKKVGAGPATELRAVLNKEGALILETREQGLRRAKALVGKYIPEQASLSQELIADRRAEAARDLERA